MSRAKHALWALLLVAACGGNPFVAPVDGTDGGSDGGSDDGGITGGREMPPGTSVPKRSSSIVRYEPKPKDGDENYGNGFLRGVKYNADTDTFTADNLAFDGDRAYSRGRQVDGLGPFAVYEAAVTAKDRRSGATIGQYPHRALYGVSRSGNTQFAIVRSGAYIEYGFGGFVYQRKGGVKLPKSGQATYRGQYAGLRDFKGAGGVGYTTGNAVIDIDFDDFDDGAAVKGEIRNRTFFDLNGRDITDDYLDLLSEQTETRQNRIPVIRFRVGPGALDSNGEILGDAFSTIVDKGTFGTFESGKYYAMLSGKDAQELVGVVVVEGDYPTLDGVTMRETGGFIAYRGPARQ
jgi:hypothetical protein